VIGKFLAGRITAARVRSGLDALRGSPLTDREFDDLWLGISCNDGHKLAHLLIRYNSERAAHHRRLETAVRRWNGPLHLVWGLDDPVSGRHVLREAVTLLPGAEVTELTGVGHYPAIGSATRCCGSSAEARVTMGTPPGSCVHRAGGPDCVTTRHVPNVEASPGTVRVAVRAAGVNYPDYLLTPGAVSAQARPPFTPGMEVAGVVAECGPPTEGSTPWPICTPVIAWTPGGGFAEQVVVSSDAVFPLPEPFSYVEGGGIHRRRPHRPITHWWNVAGCKPAKGCWCLERTEASASPRCNWRSSSGHRSWRSDPTTLNSPRSRPPAADHVVNYRGR